MSFVGWIKAQETISVFYVCLLSRLLERVEVRGVPYPPYRFVVMMFQSNRVNK
jgi:hypothetical protein